MRLWNTILALFFCIAAAAQDHKFHTLSPPGGFSYDGVTDIAHDGDGFVWVLLENDLIRFDGYEYRRYYSHFKGSDSRLLFHNVAVDSLGRLHVSCVSGIFSYDHAGDRFEKIDKNANSIFAAARTPSFDNIAGLTEIAARKNNFVRKSLSGKKLWILTSDWRLAQIDAGSRTLDTIHDLSDIAHGGSAIWPRDMIVDKYDRVWIATQQGLWFFDPRTGSKRLYKHSDTDVFSIPHNSVWKLASDERGNIWIGTFSGGLCVMDVEENKSFDSFTPSSSGLSHNMVSAFAEDERSFWIGTEGGGVNRMDKQTKHFTSVNLPSPLPSNHIKSMVCDGGNLWVATYLGGLMRLDIRSGAAGHFTSRGAEGERLVLNNMRKIVLESGAGLWIVYQAIRHVLSFMPAGGPIEHIDFDGGGQQYYILDICRGTGDALWILTQKSLYRMDVSTRNVVDVSSGKIPFMNAQSLCEDADGNIWVGTTNGTVLKFDRRTRDFTAIDGLAGYNASTVYSMCFDRDGALWMGTDNGLFRYNVADGKFARFDASDGAQGHMYTPLAAMPASDGRLLFGGTGGFSVINPLAVSTNHRAPRAMIAQFLVNNHPAPLGNEVRLSHRETSFGFRLASDNYLSPSKTIFRYSLEGYDAEPMTVDSDNRTAMYTNVPAGEYTFRVEASTDGETWGEPVTVRIVRRPAPWNSAWAWTLYCAIVLGVGGVLSYYYIEKRRLAMQLYLDGLDKQKKEEIHQSQLRFFTNISHDFRTPLSLILGAVNNLERKGAIDKYYKVIDRNSQRLLGLVNELMDFRTVENGMMQLQPKGLDINRFVKNISADFQSFARQRHIDFRVATDPSLSGLLTLDRTVVEKIVMNLLNNAFKYTSDGGSISIATRAPGVDFASRWSNSFCIGERPAQSFAIVVSDSGVGISGESISKVFERFYKVNTNNADSHLGTGIGLALVKSLVLLHKGAITIFSERDRGTDMVVELPWEPTAEIAAEQQTPPVENFDDSAAESMLMRTQKRILLVEDNAELRTMIADFLSVYYEVVQAADGQEASEWLAASEADMIVSDIMMPRKDGVTLLRETKENVATSHIPFVLLTAKTDLRSKIEGTGSGADMYFDKPVDMRLLQLSVANIFDRQSKLREYYSKNYFVESGELAQNEQDNAFLKKLIDTIDRNLTQPVIDVAFIASEMAMNRKTLYLKMKAMTDMSIVEFILDFRLRKAARMIIETDMSIGQVMESVGMRSQSYFTRIFREQFGETPMAFAKSHKKNTPPR